MVILLPWRHDRVNDEGAGLVSAAQDDKAEFESEAVDVGRKFRRLRDEVVLQYGYEGFEPARGAAAAGGTQQQFTTKTRMQCDSESQPAALQVRRSSHL